MLTVSTHISLPPTKFCVGSLSKLHHLASPRRRLQRTGSCSCINDQEDLADRSVGFHVTVCICDLCQRERFVDYRRHCPVCNQRQCFRCKPSNQVCFVLWRACAQSGPGDPDPLPKYPPKQVSYRVLSSCVAAGTRATKRISTL